MAANGTSVKKRTVEGYLHDVVQIFVRVGGKDTHLDVLGKIKFLLSRQLCAYARTDPPLDSVCPVPITLLHEFWWHLRNGNANQWAIADLLYVVFFLLCRPGKY